MASYLTPLDSIRENLPKAQAARTFDVSLSSVKRYVDKARQGESLAPKLDQKATNLLEEDLVSAFYVWVSTPIRVVSWLSILPPVVQEPWLDACVA